MELSYYNFKTLASLSMENLKNSTSGNFDTFVGKFSLMLINKQDNICKVQNRKLSFITLPAPK
jgi:hypothetical protein